MNRPLWSVVLHKTDGSPYRVGSACKSRAEAKKALEWYLKFVHDMRALLARVAPGREFILRCEATGEVAGLYNVDGGHVEKLQ